MNAHEHTRTDQLIHAKARSKSQPLHAISDGKGDFSLLAKPELLQASMPSSGRFGQVFVDLLNSFAPTTNQRAAELLLPECGKCRMNQTFNICKSARNPHEC